MGYVSATSYTGFRPYTEREPLPQQVCRSLVGAQRPPPPQRSRSVGPLPRASALGARARDLDNTVGLDAYQPANRTRAIKPPARSHSVSRAVSAAYAPQSEYQARMTQPAPHVYDRSLSTLPPTADRSLPERPLTVLPVMPVSNATMAFEHPRERGRLRVPRDVSLLAGTADLAEGSAKLTEHIPGYTGFVPRAPYSDETWAHATGRSLRAAPNSKSMMRDTCRLNMSGYGGYEPRAPVDPPRNTTTLFMSTYRNLMCQPAEVRMSRARTATAPLASLPH